jgi:hypothetical protein
MRGRSRAASVLTCCWVGLAKQLVRDAVGRTQIQDLVNGGGLRHGPVGHLPELVAARRNNCRRGQ